MKTLTALLLVMLVTSSCATLSAPQVEQEEENSIQDEELEKLESQDIALYRP